MATMNDIDWQIQQMFNAIDYYERAIQTTLSRKDADEYEDTIKKLNAQIKELERRKHDC